MSTALLVDLDGTISDSRPGIERCMRAAMAELGHPLAADYNMDWAIGPPTEDVFAGLLAPFGGGDIPGAVAIYRRHYAAGGWAENTPYDGIAEALATLAARHPLYLATSKREDFARQILDHFGFTRHFRALYGARLDGTLSHKPEMVRAVLADHGLDPARTLMIGDRRYDIEGAAANGVRGIGVLWGYGSTEELAGAAALAQHPSELASIAERLL